MIHETNRETDKPNNEEPHQYKGRYWAIEEYKSPFYQTYCATYYYKNSCFSSGHQSLPPAYAHGNATSHLLQALDSFVHFISVQQMSIPKEMPPPPPKKALDTPAELIPLELTPTAT